MKHILIMLAILPAMAMAQFTEKQTIYTAKDNVLTLSHNDDKATVLRNWKLLLSEQMYSIKVYDTDVFVVETEYKRLTTFATRIHVIVNDSACLLRCWNYYAMDASAANPAVVRGAYGAMKVNFIQKGFAEMERLALLYKEKHTGSLGSYRE